MKREYISSEGSLPYLIVKNYFSEKDVGLMMKELQFLISENYLGFVPPLNRPKAAVTDSGECLIPGYMYAPNRGWASDILMSFNKIYDDKELKRALIDINFYFTLWEYVNIDTTLVNYFEDGDVYKSHRDSALISIVYWLWEEPKLFEGGDVFFPEYGIQIPIERNQLMIMPSCTLHQVSEVKMEDKTKFSGKGRYSIVRLVSSNFDSRKIR